MGVFHLHSFFSINLQMFTRTDAYLHTHADPHRSHPRVYTVKDPGSLPSARMDFNQMSTVLCLSNLAKVT